MVRILIIAVLSLGLWACGGDGGKTPEIPNYLPDPNVPVPVIDCYINGVYYRECPI